MPNKQKEEEQWETPEHFVTVIGNFANESEEGWYTTESYKEAVEYATSWRDETRQQVRDEIKSELLEKLSKERTTTCGNCTECDNFNESFNYCLNEVRDIIKNI